MSQFSAISRNELFERRRQLRWKRRWRALQAFWRVVALLGLMVATLWLMTLPGWVIRQPSQITIRGNELLTPDMVRSLVPVRYPKSIWEIQPEAVAKALTSRGPIAQAVITRNVFPPSLTIDIQERRPVAIAFAPTPGLELDTLSQFPPSAAIGLLDATGALIPVDNYTRLGPALQLPALRILGIRDQYRNQWSRLYQEISRSPVAVQEVDWRDPANLVLKTELGPVQLGPLDHRFPQQMLALNQMRRLPNTIDRGDIVSFDLRDPRSPLIQMRRSQVNPNLNSEEDGETALDEWSADSTDTNDFGPEDELPPEEPSPW